ncbi:MAG: CPBP family intramembrane metalloprotease [Candidatus Aminicenantes bacterium]|nr:CPBP family intramembrane metalloprotease [Candidatus Aminicenantes bacterium]
MYVQGHPAILSIVLSLSAYLLYFMISRSQPFLNRFISSLKAPKTNILWVLLQRGSGIVLYGIIPALLIWIGFSLNPFDYGLSLTHFFPSLYWTLGLSAVIIPLSFRNARSRSHQQTSPQIRTREWSAGLVFLSAGSWILYLFAYEWLLRGLLFFSCLREFGLWPAVVINIILYAVFHLHKNLKEILGSFLLGFVFCMVAFQTKTIWAAFFTHTVLCLSDEWASLYFNPEIHTKWSRNRK